MEQGGTVPQDDVLQYEVVVVVGPPGGLTVSLRPVVRSDRTGGRLAAELEEPGVSQCGRWWWWWWCCTVGLVFTVQRTVEN